MKYIKRVKYLDELILLKDKHFIKVVTGVRRSGKSTILEQYIEIIKKQGIDEKQIIQFDFNNKLLKDKYKR
ncbi:hypothetical protein FACS189459_5180 [Bacilli bacterium]|nr:hypothetical protein FACS189459_5180 [Bacilli bacterium]